MFEIILIIFGGIGVMALGCYFMMRDEEIILKDDHDDELDDAWDDYDRW